ncbi:MAG: malectin domain-containing carbohydrate-binding protein, partial [Bacteroidota bacterium]
GRTFPTGNYTIRAIAYSEKGLSGQQVANEEVSFSITNSGGGGTPNLGANKSELVFDAVKNTTSPSQSVVVTNSGNASLQLTGASISGNKFQNNSNKNYPLTLNPGQSTTYNIVFKPGGSVGALNSSFEVSNSAGSNLSVGLYGLSINGLEGANEPTLNNVTKTLGYNINVGWTTLSSSTSPNLVGEEVDIQLFTKAGSGNVTMRPVARYSPREDLPYGFYTKSGNNPVRTQVGVLTDNSNEHQALFPEVESGGISFDPGSSNFGLYVESNTFGRFNYTEDELNTGGVAHRVRTYPLKDRNGALVPNAFLVCFEDANNGDYQDYVYELTNVKAPGSSPAPGTALSRINAGGFSFIDSDNNNWQSDIYYRDGVQGSKSFDVKGTTTDNLYLKYRFGSSFSYNIPVSSSTPVTLRLHFVEPYFGVAGPGGTNRRKFNVSVENGQKTINGIDLNAIASPGTAIVQTIENINVVGGVINIQFDATIDNAIVSGIEVIGDPGNVGGTDRPSVVAIYDGTNVNNTIDNGDANIPTDVSISTTQLNLPNGSLNNNTVTNNTVRLINTSNGASISSSVNSTGGGDAITLVPFTQLNPFTTYRFEITDGVKDLSGRSMIPFSVNFTTGQGPSAG